jgi:hypothetical protein
MTAKISPNGKQCHDKALGMVFSPKQSGKGTPLQGDKTTVLTPRKGFQIWCKIIPDHSGKTHQI